MEDAGIGSLLETASERYNEGRYEEAIRLWREVLDREPSNQKAREGIRMASLLTADWQDSEHHDGRQSQAGEQAEAAEVRGRIEAGLTRVKELARDGQFAEALEGCELLAEIGPDLEEVRRLTKEVRRAEAAARGIPEGPAQPQDAESGGTGIEKHLEVARQALAAGHDSEASKAARAALQLDPSSMEAIAILSFAGEEVPTDAPPRAAQAMAASASISSSVSHFEATPTPDVGPTRNQPPSGAPAGAGLAPAEDQVALLIRQGEEAHGQGRPQDAIEIWSRVFVIDWGNAQAGMLIDRAKAALEEQARHLDDLYYRAVDANEAGRREEALDLLQQVLTISPSHTDAISLAEEIRTRSQALTDGTRRSGSEAGEAAAASTIKAAAGKRTASPPARPEPSESASVPLADISERPSFLHGVPATPLKEKQAGGRRGASSRDGRLKRMLAAAAGTVVVVGAGAGASLWLGSRTGSVPDAEATVAVNPMAARARSASPAGLLSPSPAALLQAVPGSAPAAAPVTPPAQVDPEDLKAAAALTRQGQEHYQNERWAAAVLAFRKAQATDPVDFDAQNLLDKAMAELEKQANMEREMEQAARYFAEADHASALHKFYRLQQDYPRMKILEIYIRNSWFNWGVTLLQAGAVDEAAEKFSEVLELNPQDTEAARAREIAKRYHGRPREAAFDAFASTLSLRALDQR